MSDYLELENIPSVGILKYWGKDNGLCIHIMQRNSGIEPDTILNRHSIQLTRKEAMNLGLALLDFGRHKEEVTYDSYPLKDWREEEDDNMERHESNLLKEDYR
tara:strand:- start:8 stop:316 length:309 start_codon:yes stop_codon:yes gene_type:complete